MADNFFVQAKGLKKLKVKNAVGKQGKLKFKRLKKNSHYGK